MESMDAERKCAYWDTNGVCRQKAAMKIPDLIFKAAEKTAIHNGKLDEYCSDPAPFAIWELKIAAAGQMQAVDELRKQVNRLPNGVKIEQLNHLIEEIDWGLANLEGEETHAICGTGGDCSNCDLGKKSLLKKIFGWV